MQNASHQWIHGEKREEVGHRQNLKGPHANTDGFCINTKK